MMRFLIVIGIVMIIAGIGAIVARKRPDSDSWFQSKFGDGWEESFAGFWLSWRLIAAGAFIEYFALVQRGGARIFTEMSVLGTVAIIISVVSMMAKKNPSGRIWFEKRRGVNWEKSFVVKFFDWPLFLTGLFMWLPDHLWIDGLKIAGAVIAFWLYTVVYKKNKITPSKEDIVVPPGGFGAEDTEKTGNVEG